MKNECSIIGHNHNGNCLSKPLQVKKEEGLHGFPMFGAKMPTPSTVKEEVSECCGAMKVKIGTTNYIPPFNCSKCGRPFIPKEVKEEPSLCNDCFDENHCLGKVKGCGCHCQEEQPMEEWEKEFNITTKRAVLYIGENSPASRLLVEEIREQIIMFLAHQKEQQKIRIGMLRQWLNEDRITDTKKMVSNEDIIYWLNLK